MKNLNQKITNFLFSSQNETNSVQACVHSWEIVGKTYASPFPSNLTQDIVSLEKSIFGVTSFLWKCTKCSLFNKQELLGSDEDTMGELMEKAEKFGPQYITQGDKTYALVKFTLPSPQGGAIPIR